MFFTSRECTYIYNIKSHETQYFKIDSLTSLTLNTRHMDSILFVRAQVRGRARICARSTSRTCLRCYEILVIITRTTHLRCKQGCAHASICACYRRCVIVSKQLIEVTYTPKVATGNFFLNDLKSLFLNGFM